MSLAFGRHFNWRKATMRWFDGHARNRLYFRLRVPVEDRILALDRDFDVADSRSLQPATIFHLSETYHCERADIELPWPRDWTARPAYRQLRERRLACPA